VLGSAAALLALLVLGNWIVRRQTSGRGEAAEAPPEVAQETRSIRNR
jgi:hypothetical protein